MLERSVLTAGSSWHAAGGIHALNADPKVAALQACTIDLLSETEEESGHSIGLHMTGGLTMAGTPDRWEWRQANYRVFQSIGIEDCRRVTPGEAGELNPVSSTGRLPGGMWADRESYVDTTGTVHAYAIAARKRGASYFEHRKVEALEQTAEGWRVVTDKGTISCEHVVNAAGLRARQVGRMASVGLPLCPLKHRYLVSDTIPALEALDFELPMTVDLQGFTYLRQERKGVLLGSYEIDHEHWPMDVSRYGDYAKNRRYIPEKKRQLCSHRFVVIYPGEQLPAGRRLKMAPAHDAMTAASARWGVSWDLEVPLSFAPSEDFEERPSLKPSNAFPVVGAERAARVIPPSPCDPEGRAMRGGGPGAAERAAARADLPPPPGPRHASSEPRQ